MMRLFLDPAVIDKAAAPAADPKVAAEAALKTQMIDQAAKTAADAQAAAAKAAASTPEAIAAKAAQDAKAASDKAAADAKAKAEAGDSPWSGDPAAKAAADEKAKADAAAAQKLADDTKAKEKFELKVPDGAKMEAAALAKFTEEAKALGVTQEQAQKLLERDLAARKAQDVANATLMKANDQAWLGSLKTEWAGKFEENSEHVKRGFDDFDPTGKIREGLKAAGLINWPEAVKAMERHGRRIAEDKLFSQNAGKTTQQMSPEQRLKQDYADRAAGKKA